MDKNSKYFAAFGCIGILSGIYLIISGDTFIGISGTITCVFVTLMSLGYIKNPNQSEK